MREASGALFNTESVMSVDAELLGTIKQRAADAPRGRFRLCLHHSTDEPVQEMIIAHTRASYTQPHRQDASKLYVMMEGELLVVVFDERGTVSRRITLQPASQSVPCCLRMAPGWWHTTIALSDVAVVCEVLGSANPAGAASEYADWAPAENDREAVAAYVRQLDGTARGTAQK